MFDLSMSCNVGTAALRRRKKTLRLRQALGSSLAIEKTATSVEELNKRWQVAKWRLPQAGDGCYGFGQPNGVYCDGIFPTR